MKHSKRMVKLQKRIQAWEDIPDRKMITPVTKEHNRSTGTNVYRKPGSQKK